MRAGILSFTASAAYVREKERCKELLDIGKANVDEELRHTFQMMDGRGLSPLVLHDLRARVLSLVRDLQSGKAHERTADQLKGHCSRNWSWFSPQTQVSSIGMSAEKRRYVRL